MDTGLELSQHLDHTDKDEEHAKAEQELDQESEEDEEEGSGSQLTDSEDDLDAYLADDDGSEYKLDLVNIDTVKKTNHNKEMLSLCRKVSD